MYTSKWLFKWTKWWATMDIVGCSLFGSRYLRSALNVQFHAPPQMNSRHMPCASLHAAAPSQCLIISIIVIIILIIIIIIIIIRLAIRIFSTSICHVTLTFASKRVKQRNVGASPCFGWTEIFPSFCQSGDLLAHDVHIDKPKAWCQQKRARSHVGFRTEWSPASPVTQLPFVSPLLKFFYKALMCCG